MTNNRAYFHTYAYWCAIKRLDNETTLQPAETAEAWHARQVAEDARDEAAEAVITPADSIRKELP